MIFRPRRSGTDRCRFNSGVRDHQDISVRIVHAEFPPRGVERPLDFSDRDPGFGESAPRGGNVVDVDVEEHCLLIRQDRRARAGEHELGAIGFEPRPRRLGCARRNERVADLEAQLPVEEDRSGNARDVRDRNEGPGGGSSRGGQI